MRSKCFGKELPRLSNIIQTNTSRAKLTWLPLEIKHCGHTWHCYIAGVFPAKAHPFIGYFNHGHMTFNNETVSRLMPWAGNIAKTMTSNGKQFTCTREMLTAVARDQSVQLKVACCCHWNLNAFFKICFSVVSLYNKSLNHWFLGKQWFFSLESQCVLRRRARETKWTVSLRTSHQVLNIYLTAWFISPVIHTSA